MPSKATQQPHGGDPDMSEEVALLGEYEYYLSQKQELLASFEGKVVLIKGKEVIGIFDTDEAAYWEGRRRFGNVPFLIHHITQEEEVVWFPVLEIGYPDGSL